MAVKRIDFTPNVFDQQIEKHGYFLTHYRAIQCPCLDPGTGHPDPTCPYCTQGWQYFGGVEIRGLVTSLGAEHQFAETHGMLIGTMQLTALAESELGYHDRIVHQESVINYSELVTRSALATDKLRFDAVEIIRVVGVGGVVYPAANYQILNGRLEWVGMGPSEGAQYAVAYKMHPSWLILSHLHIVRDTRIKFRQPVALHHRLPLQVICKLEYLWEG